MKKSTIENLFCAILSVLATIAIYGDIRSYIDEKHYNSFSFFSASDLVYLSETGTKSQQFKVDGYIMGIADATINTKWCPKEPITYNTMNKIVSDFIYENPKLWHFSAESLIPRALHTQYPCI